MPPNAWNAGGICPCCSDTCSRCGHLAQVAKPRGLVISRWTSCTCGLVASLNNEYLLAQRDCSPNFNRGNGRSPPPLGPRAKYGRQRVLRVPDSHCLPCRCVSEKRAIIVNSHRIPIHKRTVGIHGTRTTMKHCGRHPPQELLGIACLHSSASPYLL